MISNIIKSAFIFSIAVTVAFCADGTRFNVIDGDVSEKYEQFLSANLEDSVGFTVSDPHKKINDAYAKRYGNPEDPDYDKDWKKSLDYLGFFTIANDAKLHPILITNPEVAGFSPFNLLIYKKAQENKSYIGHLSPTTMLDIVGTKDKVVRKNFIAMFEPLDNWVQDNFGGKVETSIYKTLPSKRMMNFELEFERPQDLSEYIDEFQEGFEEAFEEKKYIIAGYKNFKESYDDLELDFEEYDAFWVYSLCHFTFSYNLFNKGRPDTGVFAPCSMYMYIKKDSNKVVIGMPRLSNWVAIMNMKDDAKIKFTEKIDAEIISIMKELGAKEI